ncbi:MAG: hypothetical protein ACP5J5_05445, partial [Dissulfurimicrobium sp.]
MNHTKLPASTPFLSLVMVVFAVFLAIMSSAIKVSAADAKLIAIAPIDTAGAGNFAYLGPAVEHILSSRLYKPDIINVANPADVKGHITTMQPGSSKTLGAAIKEMGAGYFITGRVSLNGKTPTLSLQLVDTGTNKSIESLALNDALAPDALTKIDEFAVKVAEAVITGPQPHTASLAEDKFTGETANAAEMPVQPKNHIKEDNEAALARINPDYLFYEKLLKMAGQKAEMTEASATQPPKKEGKKAEKAANEAYESMLPYPPPVPPSPPREAKTVDKNISQGLVSSLIKATRKDKIVPKLPAIANNQPPPYPTPGEIEAKDALVLAHVEAEKASFPPANSGGHQKQSVPQVQESASANTEMPSENQTQQQTT